MCEKDTTGGYSFVKRYPLIRKMISQIAHLVPEFSPVSFCRLVVLLGTSQLPSHMASLFSLLQNRE